MSVRLTKIYTKSGDKGKTGLISGARVDKDHARICAIGDVDEANASLGLVVLQIVPHGTISQELVQKIQNDLFDLGADLALPEEDEKRLNPLRISESQVTFLESQIDHYNASLQPLDSFVLPGGSSLSSSLHLSRSIVRRAERSLVSLDRSEKINPFALQYLNRLSDLLFVLSRHGNDLGDSDVLWQPGAGRNN